jgi:exonuclease III
MSTFSIATWNVNSLRVRLPQLAEWLAAVQPDVVALQETKLPDADFPLAEIQALGYQAYLQRRGRALAHASDADGDRHPGIRR